MSDVTAEFRRRWRSGKHYGAWRPRCKVLVRNGHFDRDYFPWGADKPVVNADIWGESNGKPWRAKWNPIGDWIEVPDLLSASVNQDFSSDGTLTSTVTLDNVLYTEKTNMGMVYHEIRRGALAPYYGFEASDAGFDNVKKNEWYGVLTENAMVKIFMGYGLDEMEPVFVGFIDKVTPKAKPAQITITSRDSGGKLLGDQHTFRLVKSKQLREPIRFKQDKRKGKRSGYSAKASSARAEHPARFVLDDSRSTKWVSGTRNDPDNTEWVQVKLKKGVYTHFFINVDDPGMEMYVGIYAKDRLGEQFGGAEQQPPKVDGSDVAEGWVNLLGAGDVPGDVDGGWHWMSKYTHAADGPRLYKLPAKVHCGTGSILRVGFRNLHKFGPDDYHASVVRLQGISAPPDIKVDKSKSQRQRAILVQDPSDIVRVVLRWAGFTHWDVKDTGIELKGDWVFARDATLLDIIKKVRDATGYLFYMVDPADGSDLGVPTFRQTKALRPRTNRGAIRDTDLLTEMEVDIDDEPKAINITIRGRADKKNGEVSGADQTERIEAFYWPPWSLHNRMKGIKRRHYVYTNPKIKDVRTCETMARLVALYMSMAANVGRVTIPGTPEFDLDDSVAIIDHQTGVQSRLLVTSRSHTFTGGRDAKFITTLEGSMIDSLDVYQVKEDLRDYITSPDDPLSELMAAFDPA